MNFLETTLSQLNKPAQPLRILKLGKKHFGKIDGAIEYLDDLNDHCTSTYHSFVKAQDEGGYAKGVLRPTRWNVTISSCDCRDLRKKGTSASRS